MIISKTLFSQEDFYFVGHAVEVVDDSYFLQPSDYNQQSRGDSLPITTDGYDYPIIDDIYVDRGVGPSVEEEEEVSQSETGVESEQMAGGTGKTTDGRTCLKPGN